jgi:hypothetical protein
MEVRKNRVSHPNAWSQAPMWETSHLVSHVAIESVSGNEIKVRSRFHMMELRRDNVRHFGGATSIGWCVATTAPCASSCNVSTFSTARPRSTTSCRSGSEPRFKERPVSMAADKVKVGFVSTLSGPSPALGVDIRDGFQLAVKLNGGKLGGLPAEVIVADDQFKPDVAKQLFEKPSSATRSTS